MTSEIDSIVFRFSRLDDDSYRLELRGTLGETSGVFKTPFDPATWAAVMDSLESGYDPVATEPEARSNLELLGNRKKLAKGVGTALAGALLADDSVRSLFDSARREAQSEREPLPTELRFGEGCGALASLPWELLYYDKRFLVADTTIALSRYPEGDVPQISTLAQLPLRLLLILPEPEGAPPTFPAEARQSLADGLRELNDEGAIVVDEVRPATYEQLIAEVTTPKSYHVLVFIGHGVHKEGEGSFLAFEDKDGKMDRVPADDVASALRNTEVRLVLLGACRSTTISGTTSDTAGAGAPDIWQGTAQAFLRAGVPLAIGMQLLVRVDAAQTFIRQFARSLAAGKSVLEATGDGRRPLIRDRNDAWFIPALYGRPKGDTRLFEPAEAKPQTHKEVPATPAVVAPRPDPPSTDMDRIALRKFLNKSFSSAELKLLAFELGVEYDDLGFEGKSAKIIALITYFERRGRYQEFVDAAVNMQSEL